jgi:hypothetical protein
MAEDKDGIIRTYKRTREELLTAIDGLSDAQMTETSIDGWSVKDHLLHLAFWDGIRAGEVARISAGYDSVWKLTDEQDDQLNAMAYDAKKDISLDQAKWEFERSRQQLLNVLDHVTERGLDGSLYGDAGLYSGHEAQHTEWIKKWRFDKGY